MLAAPRRALVALVLVVLTLVSSSCGRSPSASPSASSRASSGPNVTVSAGALQEVAPPAAVQQLNERLNERAPQIKVLAPSDNALLPAGPWSLRLQVSDWPLADAGELGLGPHLVVQLDDQEPLRISREEAAASVAMPELRPGSHRITVYAARPWGEAVKAPGASQQIQVHRVARNGAELPAPGSAQLIAASPDGLQEAEPVLIDWLLLDAPLQNLRGDDARWRLRISVNGDSFLVDRQTPLWIKGFKRGSNAVQLELLDGRGDPLNPPFNSVVREVVIGGGDRPAWQRSSLNANELALLSGERPPAAAPEATPAPEPEPMREPEPQPEPEPISAPQPETPTPAEAELEAPEPQQAETPTPEPLQPAPADPAPSELPLTPEPPEPPTPAVSPSDAAERLTPQTSLGGSARDQVNADGSLQQPPRRGPLAGLREKLGG